MKRYTYRQNNSYGFFVGPQEVSVLAESAAEADLRVQKEHNVYFDGVAKGHDRECCGDRWNRASEYDAEAVEEPSPAAQHGNITLRDYLAGQAMAGMLAAQASVTSAKGAAHWAEIAYNCADAMLAARSKPNE